MISESNVKIEYCLSLVFPTFNLCHMYMMKIFRFQRKRFLITVSCVILIFLLEYFFWNNKHPILDCKVPAEVHENMGKLIEKLVSALDALQLSYFLCYNSLWGALKVKGPLPWQKNVDFCIFNKEVSKIDEVFLVRTFKRYGLLIQYNNANGMYSVSIFEQEQPTATLTVFEEDSVTHLMRRVGWAHRLLPPTACDQLHCFPPELIAIPLPVIKFGSHELPAPREEIEIQKYIFPDSWWKEVTPVDCV